MDERFTLVLKGNAARGAGNFARYDNRARNPYPAGWQAYCWQAGYNKDKRTIDELIDAWKGGGNGR